jgi:hypothetical protein
MNVTVIAPTAVTTFAPVTTSIVAGTDWPAVIDGCRDLLAIAFSENVTMSDTFERACREADRKAALRPESLRIALARRLLADDGISYERAQYELSRGRPAPQAMIEALMFSLRRGVGELTKPGTLRRLSELHESQVREVCRRLQNLKPGIAVPWSPEEVTALIARWRELHG